MTHLEDSPSPSDPLLNPTDDDPSQSLLRSSSSPFDDPQSSPADDESSSLVSSPASAAVRKPPPKPRLLSLDILRGLTIFSMIIVNNQPGETTFWATGHTTFWGISPTDFIFPFFLFIMGYAMGIVFSRKCRNPEKETFCCTFGGRCLCCRVDLREGTYWHLTKWGRIIRRTLLLYVLGFGISLVELRFDFTRVRWTGTLQRISFCYIFIAVLLNCVTWISVQCVIVVSLHILYLIVMYCYPTPVCGVGVITRTCSAESYFDNLILGTSHIWPHTKYFDPEGTISSLPCLSTVYLGTLCFYLARYVKSKYKPKLARVDSKLKGAISKELGDLSKSFRYKSKSEFPRTRIGSLHSDVDIFEMKDLEERRSDLLRMENYELLLAWIMAGTVFIALGIFVDFAWMRYSEMIWSSSFVFVTAGSCAVALAFVALVVDVWGCKWWAYPFWWAGVNPLFMYIAPSYLGAILEAIPAGKDMSLYQFLYHWIFQSWIQDDRYSGFLFGIVFECLFIPWAALLFWRKCYIKL